MTGLEIGGAEAMLSKIVTRLDPERFHSLVVSLRGEGPMGQVLDSQRIRRRNVDWTKVTHAPQAIQRLRQISREFQPSVIQGWMYHGNLAASFVDSNIPLIWSIRVAAEGRKHQKLLTKLTVNLGARLSKRASRIIYNSRRAMQQHQSLGYKVNSSVYIPNGFDTQLYKPLDSSKFIRETLELPVDKKVVGIVARYHPNKDHKTFLLAAKELVAKDPNVYFVMVGPEITAYNQELVSTIKALHLESFVTLLGPRQDLQGIYPAFDVCVLSSRTEGFPNVIGEAMSCGIPCVTTDAGDCAEIVDTTGAVVQKEDPGALAFAIAHILGESPAQRKLRSEAARTRIVDHFELSKVVKQFESLYEQHSIAPIGDPRSS